MAWLEVIVRGRYEIPDDLAERQRIYGSTDPEDCAAVDQENGAEDLLGICADETVSVEVRAVT